MRAINRGSSYADRRVHNRRSCEAAGDGGNSNDSVPMEKDPAFWDRVQRARQDALERVLHRQQEEEKHAMERQLLLKLERSRHEAAIIIQKRARGMSGRAELKYKQSLEGYERSLATSKEELAQKKAAVAARALESRQRERELRAAKRSREEEKLTDEEQMYKALGKIQRQARQGAIQMELKRLMEVIPQASALIRSARYSDDPKTARKAAAAAKAWREVLHLRRYAAARKIQGVWRGRAGRADALRRRQRAPRAQHRRLIDGKGGLGANNIYVIELRRRWRECLEVFQTWAKFVRTKAILRDRATLVRNLRDGHPGWHLDDASPCAAAPFSPLAFTSPASLASPPLAYVARSPAAMASTSPAAAARSPAKQAAERLPPALLQTLQDFTQGHPSPSSTFEPDGEPLLRSQHLSPKAAPSPQAPGAGPGRALTPRRTPSGGNGHAQVRQKAAWAPVNGHGSPAARALVAGEPPAFVGGMKVPGQWQDRAKVGPNKVKLVAPSEPRSVRYFNQRTGGKLGEKGDSLRPPASNSRGFSSKRAAATAETRAPSKAEASEEEIGEPCFDDTLLCLIGGRIEVAASDPKGDFDVEQLRAKLDKRHAGVVGLGEMLRAFREDFGITPEEIPTRQLEDLFKMIDKDGYGIIAVQALVDFTEEVMTMRNDLIHVA